MRIKREFSYVELLAQRDALVAALHEADQTVEVVLPQARARTQTGSPLVKNLLALQATVRAALARARGETP